MKNSASFRFGNKGRNVVHRKCMSWFLKLSEKEKKVLFKEASFRICTNLKRGYSIHLSKALTRDALGLGYKLIDHIARSSMQVLDLQGAIKREKLSKQQQN